MRFDSEELLNRAEQALKAAATVYARFGGRRIDELRKAGGDPITEVDLAIDRTLREHLLAEGEGWLSEETADDPSRLERDLVWIVDPLDGTREFIDGLPEFCTSIAGVVDGVPIVGGVLNPAADMMVTGGLGIGLTFNGRPVKRPESATLHNDRVLASRTEVGRGQWELVQAAGIHVEPMGSVAYKMARVAAGLDWATWTPVPKHEWDVAGGAALLIAAGGTAVGLDGHELQFNREWPWLEGAIAVPPGFDIHLDSVLDLARQQANETT